MSVKGFGPDVCEAMERRAEQLIEQGLAERQARGLVFARDLIDTLRRREVEALGERIAAETGRPFNPPAAANTLPAPTASASCSPPGASR